MPGTAPVPALTSPFTNGLRKFGARKKRASRDASAQSARSTTAPGVNPGMSRTTAAPSASSVTSTVCRATVLALMPGDDVASGTGLAVPDGAVAGAANRMADFATVQLRVADAAASTDAAREVLLRDLRAVAQMARAGEEITIRDRITCRRGQAFAVALAIRASEALNASTGGLGLDLTNPVQRAWRDANAVGRHVSMNWDAVGTMYGQMALGLEPKGQY